MRTKRLTHTGWLALPLTLVALLTSCRAPSRAVAPGPDDFALIEIQLQG